jgi:hypothetical protein
VLKAGLSNRQAGLCISQGMKPNQQHLLNRQDRTIHQHSKRDQLRLLNQADNNILHNRPEVLIQDLRHNLVGQPIHNRKGPHTHSQAGQHKTATQDLQTALVQAAAITRQTTQQAEVQEDNGLLETTEKNKPKDTRNIRHF